MPRRIAVAQSVLVWLAIALTALRLARLRGPIPAIALSVLLFGLLRIRDVCSVVMPEALSIAISLPLAACLLDPPRRRLPGALLGATAGALMLVRPNLGAAMFLLLLLSYGLTRRLRSLPAPVLAFGLVLVPIWMLTSTSQPLQGLSSPLTLTTLEYSWRPNPSGPDDSQKEWRDLGESWKGLLQEKGPDRGRQLVWRTGHTLLGTDFYDARWSDAYGALTRASRLLTPVLVLLATAVLIAAPRAPAGEPARVLGGVLLLLAIAQGFLLGSLPRYGIPFLPPILLFAVASVGVSWSLRRSLVAAAVFVILLSITAAHRYVLDQEWGILEASGVCVTQPIPRAAFPPTAPATLHVRLGRPVLPSATDLEILGPGGRRLYASREDSGDGAFLTIDLPPWLLEENREREVELTFQTSGVYGPHHFWLYPVIPPFWARPAGREATATLSPATGLDSGSLDWWAHDGAP